MMNLVFLRSDGDVIPEDVLSTGLATRSPATNTTSLLKGDQKILRCASWNTCALTRISVDGGLESTMHFDSKFNRTLIAGLTALSGCMGSINPRACARRAADIPLAQPLESPWTSIAPA